MIPLQTNRLILTWFLIYPRAKNTTYQIAFAQYTFAVLCFFVTSVGVYGSVRFFNQYVHTDLDASLFGVLQAAALFSATYMQICAHIFRPQIIEMIEHFSRFYKSHENNKEMFKFLVEADKRSELITIFYIKYIIKYYFIGTVIMFIINILHCYIKHQDLKAEYLYASYQMILFWNQDTAYGKIGMSAYCILAANLFLLVNAAYVTLFIGICKHCNAFFQQFQHLTKNLNPEQTNQSLCRLIKFHLTAKDVFFETADVYSVFILIVMMCSMMHTACSIFQFDLGLNHPSWPMFDIFMCLVASLSTLFLYCYFGKMASDSFANMADCLYESNWIDFSPKWRKYFVIAIGDAQQPIFYHSFHVINLHLDAFTKVLKTVFNYYMMFKTLTTKWE